MRWRPCLAALGGPGEDVIDGQQCVWGLKTRAGQSAFPTEDAVGAGTNG